MTGTHRLGILGGTFDPIHLGHLAAAEAARDALRLDRVLVVPSREPPHRRAGPIASGFHRFALVALAVQDRDRLAASDLELQAPTPSYTVNTLRHLRRQGHAPTQLFFITGADAFAEIDGWHDYPALLDEAHFVVIARRGWTIAQLAKRLPALVDRFVALDATPDALPRLMQGPCVVLIAADTPDVSATDIRTRARRGQSLSGLVPPAVERHVATHGLYSADTEPPGSESTRPPESALPEVPTASRTSGT